MHPGQGCVNLRSKYDPQLYIREDEPDFGSGI